MANTTAVTVQVSTHTTPFPACAPGKHGAYDGPATNPHHIQGTFVSDGWGGRFTLTEVVLTDYVHPPAHAVTLAVPATHGAYHNDAGELAVWGYPRNPVPRFVVPTTAFAALWEALAAAVQATPGLH